MHKILILFSLLLTLGGSFTSKAQYLKDSFSPGFTKEAYMSYARKHNNKIVIAGGFKRINETSCNGIAVLNEDGTIYNNLQSDQLEEVSPFYILASSDSSILLEGRSGTYIIYDYHLDSVSYLDIDFAIRAASFYDSRTIIVTYYDWETGEVIVKKIDEVGNEISAFERSIFDHNVETVSVLSNGKIAVAGSFESINNDTTYQKLALLNSDGQIDESFNAGYELSSYISSIKEGQNNSLFLIGYFPSNNGSSASESLIKLNGDGSLDEHFSFGIVENTFSRVRDVYTGENGAVYVTGSIPFNTTGDFKLLKLNADGSFDSTFDPFTAYNRYFSAGALTMLITPLSNDNFLLAGNFNETDFGLSSSLAVVDVDGAEVDINLQAFSAARILTSTLLSDKNILVGGDFKFFNGNASPNGIEILTPQGDRTTDFNLDDRIFITELRDAILVEDEKILLAGLLEVEGQRRRMVRLTLDGTLDESFNFSQVPSSSLVDIAYVESSKCIYAIFSGLQYSLHKYDSVGNLVESFSVENQLPENFSPKKVFPDLNGELFVSGYTSIDGGLTGGELHKITADGERITSFEVNNISQNITDLIRISDSTIMYVGGFVTSFSTLDPNPVYIINNDGEIVDQYSLALRGGNNISSNQASKIVLNSDTTKAYILGRFNFTNDYNSGQIVEINLDLSIERNTRFYSDGYIFDAFIDHHSNELTLFGDFSTINGFERYAAARISLNNFVPELLGLRQPLETAEDSPFTLQITDLIINDKDYENHQLIIGSGEFYTVGEGNEIVPESNFNGFLNIPISVTDHRDSSNIITVEIEVTPVNDVPQFVGFTVLEIEEDSSLTLKKDYFQIEDPDNPQQDITIYFESGDQYVIENDSIMIPFENFNGALSIAFHLNDGTDESEQYLLPVEVLPVNDSPIIVALADQIILGTGNRYEFDVNDFIIEDPDNAEEDFQITLYNGENYEIENNEIILSFNFSGNLSVSASVNDGIDESGIFQFPIEVDLLLSNESKIPFQELSMHPNPVDNYVNLTINDQFIGELEVSVFDLSGAELLKRNFSKNGKSFNEEINIEQLQNGIYYVKIISDDEKLRSVVKILVAH